MTRAYNGASFLVKSLLALTTESISYEYDIIRVHVKIRRLLPEVLMAYCEVRLPKYKCSDDFKHCLFGEGLSMREIKLVERLDDRIVC